MSSDTGDKRVIQSVGRAVAILDYLAEKPSGERLSVISRELGLNKSTAFSLISSLETLRLLRQDEETGKYLLGVRLLQYGYAVEKSMDIISIAQPHLYKLSNEYDETCHMAVLSGCNIVYIGKAESPKTLQMSTRIGAVMPAYCSALGKALLAYLPPNKLYGVLSNVEYKKFTPNTLTSSEDLLDELKHVRIEGCGYDREEREAGLFCVSAPIFNAQKECIAAVSLSVLRAKLESVGIDRIKKSVIDTAHDISKSLGYPL